MGIINYTDQLRYTGKGYLDSKMMPVKTVDDLKKISLTQRFEGLTITVLNDGNPQDYWLIGGITNKYWIPKKDNAKLKLILEKGFIKLMDNDEQLGEPIDLNDIFPEDSDDIYIDTVNYSSVNDEGVNGVYLCFTYSDGTQKYLDMSQFLSKTYKPGNGIIIDGDTISLDAVVLGKIELFETKINELSSKIEDEINNRNNLISSLNEKINSLKTIANTNKDDIILLKSDVSTLKERVDAITSVTEGSIPDGETIGIKDDESNSLFVKILEKDGNFLKKDVNDKGESGLYVTIPIFFEDNEL